MANLVLGNVGLRFFVLFLAVPRPLILATAALLCLTGAYVSTGSMFGIGIVLAFGGLVTMWPGGGPMIPATRRAPARPRMAESVAGVGALPE